MQERISLLIAIVAALAAVGVAGCGGDDEPPLTPVEIGPTGPTGPSGALPRSELVSEADDICAEAYTALANLPAGGTGQRASIVKGMVNSLESLGKAPSGDRGTYEDFVDALDDAANAYENDDTLAGDAALSEARQAAAEYGFKDCGEQGKELEGAGAEAPAEPAPAPEAAPPATTTPAPSSGGTDTAPDDGGGGGGGGASGGISP